MEIRILHVEDNEVDVLFVKEALRKQRYARIAADGAGTLRQAKGLLADQVYDLTLLDLNLPDSQGLDTLRAMDPDNPGTPPVIVLTNADYQSTARDALAIGAQDFLIKGAARPDELARAILAAIERRRLGLALRAERERARLYLDIAPAVILALDAEGRVTLVNRAGRETLGRAESDILGRDLTEEFAAPGENGVLRQTLRRILDGSAESESCECGILDRDGEVRRFSWRNVPLRDSSGRLRGALCAGQDITERELAMRRIAENRERLELALEAAELGLWDWRPDTEEALHDPRWLAMLGYGPDELPATAETWESRLHPEDRERALTALARCQAGESSLYREEFRLKTRRGGWKWVQSMGKVIERGAEGRLLRMIGVLQDIEARKASEEELARRAGIEEILSGLYKYLAASGGDLRELSATLLEEVRNLIGARDGFCATVDDASGEVVFHAMTGMCGDRCRIKPRNDALKLGRGPDGSYAGLWGDALNSGTAFFTNDPAGHPASRGLPEGHLSLTNLLSAPVFLGERPVGLISLANKENGFEPRDVATVEKMGLYYAVAIQRVEALTKLKESEERHRTLVELLQEGLIMLGVEGEISFVNRQICKMLGRSRTEVLNRSFAEFVAPESRELFKRQQQLRRQGYSEQYELTLLDADGGRVFTLIAPTPLFDDRGRFTGSLGVVTNITKLKLLENQLMQAQKLEAIGQLAAGVAHEINTPAQYVDNNVRYLEDGHGTLIAILEATREALGRGASLEAARSAFEALLEEKGYEDLKAELPGAAADALDGLSRIAEIVRSVKQLSHPGKAEMELTDLNEAVKSTVVVSRNEWKYVADLETEFDETLPLTPCIRGEFNQVILNLIINAAHAIQEKLGPNPERKGRILVRTIKLGNQAEIRVEDSGAGIPEAIRSKVFDPFFTTKEVGKGTGQGLAISHAVIRDKHGGEIFFETETGKGATFIVRLPLEQDLEANEAP